MKILLVEDNERLAATLSRGLREDGNEVETADRGKDGLSAIERSHPDIVILDLGLPDLDGLAVIGRARSSGQVLPILVLTARDSPAEKIRALDLGADDFVVKPFAFDEVLARVHALVRRASGPRWAPLAMEGLRILTDEPVVDVDGVQVRLSPREHALISCLVRRGGETVPRSEILRDVFGYEFDPGTNLVEVHLAHLRKKLSASRIRIETIRGFGYRAVAGQDHA